jgi:DNA-directed RNA polymerase specialized sigma24 family protein
VLFTSVTLAPQSTTSSSAEACADDAHGLAEIYGQLRRFAAVVAPLDLDPDDLVQEALVRALRLRALKDYDDLGAYLRRAMLNLAANARRRTSRHERALVRLRGGTDSPLASYPSDLLILYALSPDVRAVLYLAAVEGLSYAQIARLVGCSEAAARARACRGRRALRYVLEQANV